MRELENLVERMVLIVDSDTITTEDIMPQLKERSNDIFENVIGRPWKESTSLIEKEILKKNIEKYKNIADLEKVLNLSRSTLNRKIKEYNLRGYL